MCFAVLLLSSPLLIRDLAGLKRAVETSQGADFWYNGELQVALLKLKLAITSAQLAPPAATADEVQKQLDLAFSRINTLPSKQKENWHSQGMAELPEVAKIRASLERIDAASRLMEKSAPGFLAIAAQNTHEALEHARALSMQVVERQNSATGGLQLLFQGFQQKLTWYGGGFVLLNLGLLLLMLQHMRSMQRLRTANEQLVHMTSILRAARDEAVKANEAKSNFLANMSHELRTPLNGIIGFTEMLLNRFFGELNAKQSEYLSDVYEAAQRLLNLINGLLDLSKVEAGKQELNEEVVDLGDLVQQTVRNHRESIARAGLSLALRIAEDLPGVRADAVKLRQVLDNLLSNATKFTPSGGSIVVETDRQRDGSLRIAVADTGIGIAPADIERVFKVFEQVNSYQARQHPGTGLGMPLVKAFVELHGGTVQLSSKLNAGTTVGVILPAERVVEEGEPVRRKAVVNG